MLKPLIPETTKWPMRPLNLRQILPNQTRKSQNNELYMMSSIEELFQKHLHQTKAQRRLILIM